MHTSSRAERVFRVAGLASCLAAGLPSTVQLIAAGEPGALARVGGAPAASGPWILAALVALQLAGMTAFAAAFWWSTSPARIAQATWSNVVRLGLQLALGFIVDTNLLFIVAAQVPFVLDDRWARRWMVVQGLLTIALAAYLWRGGQFVAMEGMTSVRSSVAAIVTLAVFLAWQGFAFAVGLLAVAERRGGRELARAYVEQRVTQELLAESSRIAERLRIARELHDSLGHHLTVLSVNLELASHLAEDRAEAPVKRAQVVTRALLTELREVVGVLRDHRTIDLRGALISLSAQATVPRIHLSCDDDLCVDEPSRALVVFRCVQEAITNAVKHARARNVWVAVGRIDAAIEIDARDDGHGVDAVCDGAGLTGMRERVRELGGTVTIASGLRRGFRLHVHLPDSGAPS
ncbi:MAG: sensor histidine kinase [Vicinamibacterales bacterium]